MKQLIMSFLISFLISLMALTVWAAEGDRSTEQYTGSPTVSAAASPDKAGTVTPGTSPDCCYGKSSPALIGDKTNPGDNRSVDENNNPIKVKDTK